MVKDFPYLHSHRADLAVNLIFLAVYIIIDLFLFCYSVGRYHLLDYIFYLQLNGHGYKRKGQLSLITILSAISIFVCIHFAVFRYQTNFANLMDHFIADLHVENFPQAIYSNNKCVVIKQKSANVILPTVLHSFLFNKEYEQKTIYLYLPLTIFNSEKDRETICNEVLMQSKRNDVFFRYSPTQTRIIASTFKQGKFLEYYNYFYIYYHYSDLPEWGINGGLRADSTVVNKYVDFVYGCNENLRNRIKSYNPNSKDLDLNDKIISTSFTTTIHHNKVEIKSNNTKMTFDKIEFSKVEMHGSASINFPPKAFMYQMDFRDILNNEIVESDENVSNLIFARSEVSNPNL